MQTLIRNYVFIEEHDCRLIKSPECYVIIAKLGYGTRIVLSIGTKARLEKGQNFKISKLLINECAIRINFLSKIGYICS